MSHTDHCFLLATSGGERAMAFCAIGRGGPEEAREQVAGVLEREKGYESYDLAYLGLLDYREMDGKVESMLEPFEKKGPVWLVFFR